MGDGVLAVFNGGVARGVGERDVDEHLAGGGSLLRAFPDRVAAETQLPVHVAESPLTCVAIGSGLSLQELDTLASTDRGRR